MLSTRRRYYITPILKLQVFFVILLFLLNRKTECEPVSYTHLCVRGIRRCRLRHRDFRPRFILQIVEFDFRSQFHRNFGSIRRSQTIIHAVQLHRRGIRIADIHLQVGRLGPILSHIRIIKLHAEYFDNISVLSGRTFGVDDFCQLGAVVR